MLIPVLRDFQMEGLCLLGPASVLSDDSSEPFPQSCARDKVCWFKKYETVATKISDIKELGIYSV